MKIRQMTIEQKLHALEISPEDISKNTYVYIDENFRLSICEKVDRYSSPIDELMDGEYVVSYDGDFKTYYHNYKISVEAVEA